MSYLKLSSLGRNDRGFTLIELMIVMILSVLISLSFYTFFKTNLFTYLDLQNDASSLTDLAQESQRIATVVRGLTDITTADANDLTIYSYFYPTDTYVSQVKYYVSNNQLLADVTPMTANPPVGSLLPDQKKTYTIIGNFSEPSGTNLFTYLDSSGSSLAAPVSDLHTIKGITVSLASPNSVGNGHQSMTLTVSLRNRKTNL